MFCPSGCSISVDVLFCACAFIDTSSNLDIQAQWVAPPPGYPGAYPPPQVRVPSFLAPVLMDAHVHCVLPGIGTHRWHAHPCTALSYLCINGGHSAAAPPHYCGCCFFLFKPGASDALWL
eukprot:scaffold26897_cov22-Tisochrysis_lutea.AAC.1